MTNGKQATYVNLPEMLHGRIEKAKPAISNALCLGGSAVTKAQAIAHLIDLGLRRYEGKDD